MHLTYTIGAWISGRCPWRDQRRPRRGAGGGVPAAFGCVRVDRLRPRSRRRFCVSRGPRSGRGGEPRFRAEIAAPVHSRDRPPYPRPVQVRLAALCRRYEAALLLLAQKPEGTPPTPPWPSSARRDPCGRRASTALPSSSRVRKDKRPRGAGPTRRRSVVRMACVDLPAFPLQLLLQRHPEWRDLAAAVVDETARKACWLWVNERARAGRVLPGMRYAGAAVARPGPARG